MKNSKNQSRRHFFKLAGIGAATVAGLPALASSCTSESNEDRAYNGFFSTGDVVLFQGDSITDAGRNKKTQRPNNGRDFGSGYAHLIASRLLEEMPGKDLTFYNRGISGNKVYQLDERWQEDCLDLKPDILSILIGVNDYWHFRQGRYDGTPEIYETDYRKLLNRTFEALPDLKLIICQPFILSNTSAVDDSWLEAFSSYQEIAVKLAKEFGALLVPFQTAFTKALALAPETYWAGDGVHPSMAGAQLMADSWLEAVSAWKP